MTLTAVTVLMVLMTVTVVKTVTDVMVLTPATF